MQDTVHTSLRQKVSDTENRYFAVVLRICVGVLGVMVLLAYLLPADFLKVQQSVNDVMNVIWPTLSWLAIAAFVIGAIELLVVAYRYFRHHSYSHQRLVLSLTIVVIYVFFLGMGSIMVPWGHKSGLESQKSRTSTYESAKAQIDVCNVKSITYIRDPIHPQQSNGDMILHLYRTAPDVDKNGRQVAATDKMTIAFANRDRVKREIDQLKPSCPKDIPVTISDK